MSDALIQAMERVQSLESENNRLKDAIRRLAEQDATLSVHGGNVTVTMDGTLADEERDVLDRLAHDASYRRMEWTERVLRGLLKRLK